MNNTLSRKPGLIPAIVLAIAIGAAAGPARAQSAAAEGQKLAFDRGKGNCLTCHVIKGGDLPGSIGPQLVDIKSKYPDRNDLVSVRTKPDFDRKGNQCGGGFLANPLTARLQETFG